MDYKQFLFFLSPSSETRAPKNDHACRCSRARTPFTKSGEKERLLAVYEQDGQKEWVCNLLPLNQEGHSRKIAG